MNATSMKAFLGVMALGLSTGACATESTMVRTMSEPQEQEDQTPAASYPIPKTEPKGTAYVLSLGRESLTSPAGAQAMYLHLRLAAENRSDTGEWTLDAHDQVIDLGGATAEPTYAQASKTGSALTLAPGQNGFLDLFYALPQGGIPPQAVLTWKIRRGAEVVSDATPFALQSAQTPEYAYYQPVGVTVQHWPASWWGVGFYGPWWWGPGWGPYPYWSWYRGPSYHGGFHGGFRPGYHGRPGAGWVRPPAPRGGGGGWRMSPPSPRGFRAPGPRSPGFRR